MSIVETPRLSRASAEELRESLTGEVVTPADAGYESARRVWNGAIDRRPAVVARCTSAADVAEAIRFARSERLSVAIRGGGHNVAGHGTCDAGIVIAPSPMRGARSTSGPGLRACRAAPCGPTSTRPPSASVSPRRAASSPRPESAG